MVGGGRTSLYERQWNEVDAIKSIYMDEYEELAHPWKVDHPPSFVLHFTLIDDTAPLSTLAIDVLFKLSPNYPDVEPEITVSKKRGILSSQATSIQEQMIKKAKDYLGNEMIFDLAEFAKELLANAANKKVSFHDEMTLRKTQESIKLAKEMKATLADDMSLRMKELELGRKIEQDLAMKEELLKAQEENFNSESNIQQLRKRIKFDPALIIDLPDAEKPISVEQIEVGEALLPSSNLGGQSFFGKSGSLDFYLTLISFEGTFYHSQHGQKKIQILCKKLQSSQAKYNPLYCRVFGAVSVLTGEKQTDFWIVQEYHEGVSLKQLVDCSGTISIKKSIMYIQEVLQALVGLHAANIAHQDLTLANVLITLNLSRVRLISPIISRLLKDLDQIHPISNKYSSPSEEISWRPPEVLTKGSQGGKKADVWYAGYLLLQMIFGRDYTKVFETAEAALSACKLPQPIKDLLESMLCKDPNSRPSPSELLTFQAFEPKSLLEYDSNQFSLSSGPASPAGRTAMPFTSLASPSFRNGRAYLDQGQESDHHYQGQTQRRNNPHDQGQLQQLSQSRYRTDFEEVQFLGKGAFGQVIKVRNKIDNRFYAIKKVRLDPSSIDYNRKILREVATLSRLHHDRIVRYFQAWIEESGTLFNREREGSSSFSPHADDTISSSDSESENDSDYSHQIDIDDQSNELFSNDYQYRFDDGHDKDDNFKGKGSQFKRSKDRAGSSKLYSSNLVSSTISLSSLIQLHTGFTSDEDKDGKDKSASSNLVKSSPINSMPLTQYLYIQMEYCPNQTLRDVIDAGVDGEECWRLFRQIVEGLCHLHSQGMIHRDLKPGNIFLDTNGDVKIGDFGLAIGDDGEFTINRVPTPSLGSSEDQFIRGSLTGGVGTPLYVSPEQEKTGLRYNQKVDMYSLGVILLELLVPFSTGMERALVIKDARSPAIKLPSTLTGKAELLLKNLLDHDPKTRMASEELLKSDLLPPKVEDEYVNEAIRSITNPNTPYFGRLLSSIFSIHQDPTKAYTFDFNSGISADINLLASQDFISSMVETICRRHGAIKFSPPLLTLYTMELPGESPVMLLNKSGSLVQLSSNLTFSFARFVAFYKVVNMRRFVQSPVFRENITGGQPCQPLEAAFDIVFSSGDYLIPTLEVVKVTVDVICKVIESSPTLILRLGHGDLLAAILDQSLVPLAKHKAVLDVLCKNSMASWTKVKNLLASQVPLPASSVDSIGKLAGLKDLDPGTTLKRLEELLRKECTSAIRYLLLFCESLQQLEIKVKVVVDPLFVHGDGIFSGMIFQLYFDEKKRTGPLASGGEYGKLIDSMRLPTDRTHGVGAVGVIWNVSRLISIPSATSSNSNMIYNMPKVIIYSSGFEMLQEKLSVAVALWNAGILVDIVREDSVTAEYIVQLARVRGIHHVLYLKDNAARGQFGIIKLRNLERRTEIELLRSELGEAILGSAKGTIIGGGSNGDGGDGGIGGGGGGSSHELAKIDESNLASLNVSLFAPFTKIKGSQRNAIMEKTARATGPILASFTGPKPVEVIAHELPRDLIRKIVDTIGEGEEILKKIIDSRDDRETASKLRSLLRTIKEKKATAILYNYKERLFEIVSLLQVSAESS